MLFYVIAKHRVLCFTKTNKSNESKEQCLDSFILFNKYVNRAIINIKLKRSIS